MGLLGATELLESDPALEAAYYACADALIERIIVTPAGDLVGVRVKAEAVAWCCASRTDFSLGETMAERVITALLVDLLAPASA